MNSPIHAYIIYGCEKVVHLCDRHVSGAAKQHKRRVSTKPLQMAKCRDCVLYEHLSGLVFHRQPDPVRMREPETELVES